MPTHIIGILNVTPDSFSDGGKYEAAPAALTYAKEMLAKGVHVLDVGAESTRPGATPLTPQEEWQRLESVLPALIGAAHAAGAKISIDTKHAATAAQALKMGADWINDVNGLKDPAMLELLATHDCPIVFMHSLSIPADPQLVINSEEDVIEVLHHFTNTVLEKCHQCKIARPRLIFDPGIGFGKTAVQSLEILRRVSELKAMDLPLLIGHSRKSFLRTVTNLPAGDRDGLTLAVSEYLMTKQVDYLRVHNVPRHMELLKLHEQLHTSKP